MDSKIGVAINSCGSVAYEHARAYLRDPRCEIVGVASRTCKSAEKMISELGLDCTIYPDYDALLSDSRVQAVSITSPNYLHAAEAAAALRADKHVLLEKPPGITHAELDDLSAALQGRSLTTLCSFVLRWNPLVEALTALRDQGAFGELFFVQTDYWHGVGSVISPDRWLSKTQYAGSAVLAGGSHAVDLARHFAGDIESVSAFSLRRAEGFDYDTTISATLRLTNGGTGRISVSFDAPAPYQFNIEFIGSQGVCRQNRVWSEQAFPGQGDWVSLPQAGPDSGAVSHHPFNAEIAHFLDRIQEGRDGDPSLSHAIETARVCLAISESATNGGQPVKVKR
ncbi:MAG: Gfo/Idh/MocA family oxidoreductase [Armatimonadia bacterium]